MYGKKTEDKGVKIKHLHARRLIVNSYFVVMIMTYLIVIVHTPITINRLPHDDSLFVALGRSLAEGRWLGQFSQFTLMKGPGYPAFLALANWLGVSVSLAHALFHCFAVTFFVAICHLFVRSAAISGVLFTLLLWHPISLSAFLLRVIREQIYYAQVLIVLAAFAAALFYARGKKQGALLGTLCGVMLGWFWLTREEGVWIIPAIALMALAATFHAVHERRIRELIATLLVAIGVFAGVQVGFRAINWAVYGKFVGVDIKETNFQRALGALHSVRSGGVRPLVSVTRAARERIYAVSPTFASVKWYFEGTAASGWVGFTCQLLPGSCGEIGAGWFIWALRDAASAGGHYSSPAKASLFFGQLADEVSTACAGGALECAPQLIAEMPPVSWSQVVKLAPARYLDALNLLLLLKPPLQLNPSVGPEELLAADLRFLNYPLHTQPAGATAALPLYVLSGWYYKSGHDWISVTAKAPSGSPVDIRVERTASPDIQAGSKDPAASDQRFMIRARCTDDCLLTFVTLDGAKLEKPLADFIRGSVGFDFGGGHIHVDSAAIHPNPTYVKTPIEAGCDLVRKAILTYYHLLFVPLLVLGALAFLAATFMYPRIAVTNVTYILALVSWLLVFLRASLLVLIDVTSFLALLGFRLAPAHYMLVSGAVLSCAAWLQLFRTLHSTGPARVS
jgi:hypothetical protein